MREKLLSLPLAELREIARAKGIKNIAATRKSALVDKLVALAEEEQLHPQNSGLQPFSHRCKVIKNALARLRGFSDNCRWYKNTFRA